MAVNVTQQANERGGEIRSNGKLLTGHGGKGAEDILKTSTVTYLRQSNRLSSVWDGVIEGQVIIVVDDANWMGSRQAIRADDVPGLHGKEADEQVPIVGEPFRWLPIKNGKTPGGVSPGRAIHGGTEA